MPYPVTVNEAVKIEQDVIHVVEEAVAAGRLEAAVDIMLEYVSASLCLDMIDDLYDMLADEEAPAQVPKNAEEWREFWNATHVHPIEKEE